MKTIILILSCFCWLSICTFAQQPDCSFTHYSSENGLSQNTIMSILQDHKGNMWFSTWDGINKFDGYTFRTYKARPGNQIALTNNRVDYMEEDKYGYIWLLTYDNQPYRFDPRTEIFERILCDNNQSLPAITSFRILSNGVVWLLTKNEGAIRVETHPETFELQLHWFRSSSEEFPATMLNDVILDKSGCEWLLTDGGLGRFSSEENSVTYHFNVSLGSHHLKNSPFFTGKEGSEDILFGSAQGMVWRYLKQKNEFIPFQLHSDSDIIAIRTLGNGQYLLVTRCDGFFLYDKSQGNCEHFSASLLPKAPITSVYIDAFDEVWFEQHVQGTVAHFNPYLKKLKTEVVPVEPTRTDRSHPSFKIHEDIYGTVWVHPYGGGFSRYDRQKNALVPFFNSLLEGEWRFSNKLHAAFSDRQGNLWLCTHSKGLEKISFRPIQFSHIIMEEHDYESVSNEVRALYEDSQQNIWAGIKDGMLRVYDSNHREKGYLTESGYISFKGTPLRGVVYFIMEDRRKNLWIATKGDGLVKAQPVDNHYRLTRYQHDARNPYSLSDDNVYCVYEDRDGKIWVATFGGGLNVLTQDDRGQEIFWNHRNRLKQYPMDQCSKVRCITGDGQGQVWIGTTVGALRVKADFDNPEEVSFQHFVRIPNDISSLSHNDVHWILSTHQHELYLATFGGGLNKLVFCDDNGKFVFHSYSVEDGLASDVLLSLREDRQGNLWMSTENGICKFVPSKEQFEVYTGKAIPFRVRFSEAASRYTTSHTMMFGTNTGIFAFQPDSIQKSHYVPPMVFSKLLVANEDVRPGKHSVLPQRLDDVQELVLSHRENIFSIQYAALDFSNPEGVQYAFQLEGLEKNWNYVGGLRMATYTNLPKGHYRFKVRSTNADGVWVDNMRTLDIEILPSFWETTWAYVLYILVLFLVVVGAVYILFTIYRLKHRVQMEHQMTDMKLRFFTDISHELRTPLTLIVGPVENVMHNLELPDEARTQLQVVERNTKRMLRLINQILDFRKIQNKKMKLRVQCVDVVPFTRRIMDNFLGLAEEKSILFKFDSALDKVSLWVDADKFEKIVFNLLSNAFKYTSSGKCITVFIREEADCVSVGVQDQGIGIEENRQKSVFLRFENLVDRNLFTQSSTGIGLSLVKELVEMHHAVITLESQLGKGSCFRVDFKKGKEHYGPEVEFLQDDVTAVMNAESAASVPVRQEGETDAGRELMLLVEDNAELRYFLRSIFSSDYHILEAENGEQGLEMALAETPDIIISDVMMPVKDGIAMTRELRANLTTSHIPLVLLTAKTSIENQLEGLEYGADDYITKPFSATYLKARVKNLLVRKAKWQEIYRKNLLQNSNEVIESPASQQQKETVTAEEKETVMSSQDRKFMDKLMELMEKNLDNGDLVVDDLVQELAVSRSVFFKKLKSLTGLAPVEFIKEMRMNKAVQLIETGEYSMTQIAYMVGINDPRYFSKCFKQKMGMTPTEYKEKKGIS